MKKRLQGLGIGLFIAGASLALMTQFSNYKTEESADEVKQLQQQLAAVEQELANANEGIAQSTQPNKQEDVNELTDEVNSADVNEDQTQKDTSKNSTNVESSSTDKTSGTIMIYEGVSLYDIGKQAEDQGIVQNGRELELYLSKPEYARSIQKGQFELHSEMSLDEMANRLTGKR